MRALATTLVLVASATAAPPDAVAEAPPAGAVDAAAPTSTAVPARDATPAEAPRLARRRAPVAPTQAVIDKVGLGDRLFLAGDHQRALFAYQDAVHAQPTYAPARVRLGRAYLALRYPDMALTQAELALAEDPDDAEARKLLDDARSAPPRSRPGAAVAPPPAAAAVPAAGGGAEAKPGPRLFKLTPDGAAAASPRPAAAGGAAAAGAAAGAAAAAGGAAAGAPAAAAPEGARQAAPAEAVSQAQRQVAALHYRTALGFLQNRDWTKAVAALSDAILADPTLAVAFSARGSAHFGLGKYREASEDYGAAIRLDPKLGTPLYGLAECYRVQGDGKKAAGLYERYAQSSAPDVRDDLRAVAARRAKELR